MGAEILGEHVRQTFASGLAEIRDESLREGVIRTWVRAMVLGGATDLWYDLPFSVILKIDGPGLGVQHTRGVTHVAVSIADSLCVAHEWRVDRDIVAAGALVHDVGKLLERAPAERHELAGPLIQHEFSGVWLGMQEGLPRDVLHIISCHFTFGDRIRRTPECAVVYQADQISSDTIARQALGKTYPELFPYVFLLGPSGPRERVAGPTELLARD